MILVDANILLYAEDSLSAQHAAAREWWDKGKATTMRFQGDIDGICYPRGFHR